MFISTPFFGGPPIALDACEGRHRDPMRRCPDGTFACHAGTLTDEPDVYQSANRALAFIAYMRWSQLVATVDMAEVDELYNPGERVVTLHKNDGLFQDDNGFDMVVYAVTQRNRADVTCFVNAFTDEQAARAAFAAAIEP